MSNTFVYIEKLINSILTNFDSTLLTSHMTEIKVILSSFVIVWLMIKGYQVLAGKHGSSMGDLVYQITAMLIIIFVAFDATWIGRINGAIEGIHTWASGGTSLYAQLDAILDDIIKIGITLEKTDGVTDFSGAIAQIIVWISFSLVASFTIVVLIFTTLTLKFLLVLTPLMIITLMFGWFKNIFARWIEILVSNTLTLLFVGLFFQMFSNKYKGFTSAQLAVANGGDIDVFSIASDVFFVSFVMLVFIVSSVVFASKLANVSIDDDMKNSIRKMFKGKV